MKTKNREMQGYPVREATAQLRIVVKECDAVRAKRKDPSLCVIANACLRLYDCPAVYIYRQVAYVVLPDENGKQWAERYHVSAAVRAAIKRYDKTGVPPVGGFLLLPPPKSETLDALNGRRRKSCEAKKPRKRADIKGSARRVKGGKGEKSPVIVVDNSWRHGIGQVHFPEKAA